MAPVQADPYKWIHLGLYQLTKDQIYNSHYQEACRGAELKYKVKRITVLSLK